MDWFNFHIPTDGRSPEFVGSSPAERGTWLSVMLYACQIECSGRIPGAANWKDRQWQQAAGVTLEEVKAADRLLRFDGDDLVVNGYPVAVEKQVRKNRKSAKAGGMARWHKTDAERQPHADAEPMPPGMPPGDATPMPPGMPPGIPLLEPETSSKVDAKGEGEGEGEGEIERENAGASGSACARPARPAQPPAAARSWMAWRLEVGRGRVYIDVNGNSEAGWSELFKRAGWDEFNKAWDYCRSRTEGKVFLANMLEVLS